MRTATAPHRRTGRPTTARPATARSTTGRPTTARSTTGRPATARPDSAPAAMRRMMAVAVPIVWLAGAALGLPPGAHGGVPAGSGPSRTRCATTCRGRCRSARRARPFLP